MAKLARFKLVYVVTRGLDIQNIIAYQHYKKKDSSFITQKINELQVIIDHEGCADSLRVIYKK